MSSQVGEQVSTQARETSRALRPERSGRHIGWRSQVCTQSGEVRCALSQEKPGVHSERYHQAPEACGGFLIIHYLHLAYI